MIFYIYTSYVWIDQKIVTEFFNYKDSASEIEELKLCYTIKFFNVISLQLDGENLLHLDLLRFFDLTEFSLKNLRSNTMYYQDKGIKISFTNVTNQIFLYRSTLKAAVIYNNFTFYWIV